MPMLEFAQPLFSKPLNQPWVLNHTIQPLFSRGVAPLFCCAGNETLTFAMSDPAQRQPLLAQMAQEGTVLPHPSLLTRPLHEMWDGDTLIGLMATQSQVRETSAALELTLSFEMVFVCESRRGKGLAKEMVRGAAGEALALIEGRLEWLEKHGRSVEVTLKSNDRSAAGQALFDIAEEMVALVEDDAMLAGVDFSILTARGI